MRNFEESGITFTFFPFMSFPFFFKICSPFLFCFTPMRSDDLIHVGVVKGAENRVGLTRDFFSNDLKSVRIICGFSRVFFACVYFISV